MIGKGAFFNTMADFGEVVTKHPHKTFAFIIVLVLILASLARLFT
ncbi:MAG: hypothetical protein UX07_C0012G0007 [Parcubacteria group bacterium GW2011_GWA2_45_30]|nr:MAG: hypothetical protein UX07_C0012G0007 [Parcubacteria group bacterium GW2011_GWA2_45_30]